MDSIGTSDQGDRESKTGKEDAETVVVASTITKVADVCQSHILPRVRMLTMFATTSSFHFESRLLTNQQLRLNY